MSCVIHDLVLLKSWFVITVLCILKCLLSVQIPGMNSPSDGVFNTFMAIAKHEGLKGLYRSGFSESAFYF